MSDVCVYPGFPGLWSMLGNLFRDPAVVRARRDQALRRLLRHAQAISPFYRELWQQAGVSIDQIRTGRQLARLPVVDKARLIAAEGRLVNPQAPAELIQTMSTSGTSGQTITLKRVLDEMIVVRQSFARPLLMNGARPGQRFITFASPWLEASKGQTFRQISQTRFIGPGCGLDEQIRIFQDFRPHGVIGQAGGIYLLARELLRRKRTIPVGMVFVYGTTLMPEMRAAMERAFGSRPVDVYGAVEFGWIAWECRRGGLHVDADRLIVEIVDDQDRPLPPGEIGHVVITSLYGYTMPLIRYRLADLAALAPKPCACWCRFPLLESIQGRVNDFLPTPAGERVSPHFFFHLFDGQTNPVAEWRLTQHTLADLEYTYIPDPNFDPAVFAAGMEQIRRRFGPTVTLRTTPATDIPLTPAGKRMCIVSKLRPGTLAGVQPWTEGEGRSQ